MQSLIDVHSLSVCYRVCLVLVFLYLMFLILSSAGDVMFSFYFFTCLCAAVHSNKIRKMGTFWRVCIRRAEINVFLNIFGQYDVIFTVYNEVPIY